ncbi:hypothetical protein HRI_003722200 [Hibiscus trionum]|uniref:Uncharacterized protein n=1 Tax=Hibiscus trionum TaxID=183268 RepID=A0A9W7IPX3_HIBTR|nr:hypothetical protein HRI_003722200 [Hibiscus trionum]
MARKRPTQDPPPVSSSFEGNSTISDEVGEEENTTLKRQKAKGTETEKKTKALSSEDNVDFWEEYPFLEEYFEKVGSFLLDYVEMNAGPIEREKLKELERKEKQLRIQKLELFLEYSKLLQEVAEAELDYIKGNRI